MQFRSRSAGLVAGVFAAVFLISGCSERTGLNVPQPQLNKTATGAIGGTIVGGGLGLIVGSTSGNAGEGLLVGSLAGGALGAGIGAKLQRDEEGKVLEAGRDTTVRQGETIKQQNIEIDDLKKNSGDDLKSFYDAPIRQPQLAPDRELNVPRKSASNNKPASKRSARASLSGGGDINYLSRPSGVRKASAYNPADTASVMPVSNRTSGAVTAAEVPKTVRKNIDTFTAKAPVETTAAVEKSFAAASKIPASGLPAAATAAALAKSPDTGAKEPKDLANCKEALKEAERGLNAGSDADRLFYLRRAARLCPTEASYHVELGKLYSAIGKNEDAKYELRQAIDLDANNQVARDELSIIENAGSAQ